MATYHRWFILPAETYENSESATTRTFRKPKYVLDESRLDGYTSGSPYFRQEIEDVGYSHLLNYNGAEEWYVVVAWGEGDEAKNALQEIDGNNDVVTLPTLDQYVKPVLDYKFGQGSWTVTSAAIQDSTNTGV